MTAESVAIIVGASGGIGRALCENLRRTGAFDQVTGLARPALDLCDEASIASAARATQPGTLRLFINAAGLLHNEAQRPEKSLRNIDPQAVAQSFAVNATGPALLMKHFLPLFPRQGRAVFASLSARVGSIGDNRLGGWYGYRASKAALNQFIRTAAIELSRTHPEAVCIALHPGTVATALSAPFVRDSGTVLTPEAAADHLLTVIAGLTVKDNGCFFDWRGTPVPW
jgi:NAD(P)-dependent dehydrogenase (short-subunit alcohol dehydrogenase family)